jgi:hypothetical protein
VHRACTCRLAVLCSTMVWSFSLNISLVIKLLSLMFRVGKGCVNFGYFLKRIKEKEIQFND